MPRLYVAKSARATVGYHIIPHSVFRRLRASFEYIEVGDHVPGKQEKHVLGMVGFKVQSLLRGVPRGNSMQMRRTYFGLSIRSDLAKTRIELG